MIAAALCRASALTISYSFSIAGPPCPEALQSAAAKGGATYDSKGAKLAVPVALLPMRQRAAEGAHAVLLFLQTTEALQAGHE